MAALFCRWLAALASLLHSVHSQSTSVALSHITLLLPYPSRYEDSPTQYKISSRGGQSNGCVQWSVEPKHDVIDIIPLSPDVHDHECPGHTYNEAIIKVTAPPENGRRSATIKATDPKTGKYSQCEVFIDKVHKLQVATSTRLIYLNRYESIEVHGFDDKGNKFTTLHGLRMIWSGIGIHLQSISFEDASLMLPDIQNDYDDDAIQKNKNPLPVKGIKTGQEDVEVLIDFNQSPAHKGCQKAQASLFVVRHLQLLPRVLYAAKCCQATFHLITTSNHYDLSLNASGIEASSSVSNKYSLIRIPQSQYEFKLENRVKMHIEQNGQLTTSNINENGKLRVEDKVTSHDVSIENTADALIHVVDAHSIYAEVIKYTQKKSRPMYFRRDDDADWYLDAKEKYFIRLSLQDARGNTLCVRDMHLTETDNKKFSKLWTNLKSWDQVYICSGIEWQARVVGPDSGEVEKVVHIEAIAQRDNEFVMEAMEQTEFTLKFSATGSACRNERKRGEVLATSTKHVIVTSSVQYQESATVYCPNALAVNQKRTALIPYTGRNNVHRVPVFFHGGSGRYRLEIEDTNITYLSSHDAEIGQMEKDVLVYASKVGKTQLFVTDYNNPDNFDVLEVEVQPIHVLRLYENVQKEILMEDSIQIPLIIRDEQHRRFSSLDGVKQVIEAQTLHKHVNVEFVAPSIDQIREQFYNGLEAEGTAYAVPIDDRHSSNEQIVKGSRNREAPRIDCRAYDGAVMVYGISEGYERFSISVTQNEHLVPPSMFVSVYKEIVAQHDAVAIAMNINEQYTMKWNYGPLPWPIDVNVNVDDTKFEEPFLNQLQVTVHSPFAADVAGKYFGVTYNGKTLEFICRKEFHETVQLMVQNKQSDSLPKPIESIAEIEVFCFPQFQFNSSKIEMGVGTRRKAREFYPNWIKSEIASEFTVNLYQKQSDIVSIVNSENFVAKRLGSSIIEGRLQHSTQRVHIHPAGFSNKLQIIVLFKAFSMEMPSYWIISGQEQIAHIEGLDGNHHILPFRHNFDDVFIEWMSEDANIVELLPVLPNNHYLHHHSASSLASATSSDAGTATSDEDKRNNVGTGLSVKLQAHSVGQVNIKASITLRNAPKNNIKTQFEIVKTVTVIPQVVDECNLIILKPNSSLSLSSRFNPDTSVTGIGQIYEIEVVPPQWIQVSQQQRVLTVDKDAPIGHNIAVTFLLQSPIKKKKHKPYSYPLTQATALMLSIVEPTGLHLLHAQSIIDNIIYTQSLNYLASASASSLSSAQPFWGSFSAASSASNKRKNRVFLSKTDNILCEKQNVTLQIAILDELARPLHVMDQMKVFSNDTTVVSPRKDIQIRHDSKHAPMYATVQLDAIQPGFATITFREKEAMASSSSSSSSSSSDLYVYDDPKFLRTFLTIHVLSSEQCESVFGVMFSDESVVPSSSSKENRSTSYVAAATTRQRMERETATRAMPANNYKNAQYWQAKTVKRLPTASSNLVALILVVALCAIIACTWSRSCGNIIFGNLGYQQQHDVVPPAAFNPYAPVQDSIMMHTGTNPSPLFRRSM